MIAKCMVVLAFIIGSSVLNAQVANIENDKNNEQYPEVIELNVGLIVFPPFIRQEENVKCFGEAIDALHTIFAAPLYKLNVYCSSPSRIYKDFAYGKIDITYSIKSNENLGTGVFYSTEPFRVLEVTIFKRAPSQGKTISSIRAYTYNGQRNRLEQEGYVFQDHANTRAAATYFLRGGTDALISYKKPFEFYLEQLKNQEGFSRLKSTFDNEIIERVESYFVVNQQSPMANTLIEMINNRVVVSMSN